MAVGPHGAGRGGGVLAGLADMTAAAEIALRHALIVEDDSASRQRLRSLLALVAGEPLDVALADSVAAGQAAAGDMVFDLALVDVGLPDGSGIELIDWMHAQHPETVCVVITALGDEDTVLRALRAGAIGYLLKGRDDAELVMALRNIQRGGAPIDPFVARRILALLPTVDAVPMGAPVAVKLTDRECEILKLVARGRNNRQIAEAIELSRFTVEDYTKRIYRKLAVGSRAEAVFKAQAQGLLG